jgi:CheY-like chemotaxis protein
LPLGWPVARLCRVTRRILIVDDSGPFRATAAELLVACGLALAGVVADGEAALAAVSDECPDGVLLDVNLPGPDGFAVAASITSACPAAVIVLTSSDVEEMPGRVVEACGAVAFVPKTELALTNLKRLFAAADPGRVRTEGS